MTLSEGLHVLELPTLFGGQHSLVYLCVIVDVQNGATLVDAGPPGQEEAIVAILAEVGVGLGDLRQIVLTHQDLDHVGSLRAIVAASTARVLAHEIEAPFIDGRKAPRFAESFQPTSVDRLLTDGDRLPVAGGVRIIATPGHTPGHLCLYLERSRTLIAGDALLAHRGRVYGPSSEFSADLDAARESVRKLAELDVRAIVCYHGGVVDEDANGQLRRLAGAGGWSPA
jgi:glyoxylase-like metal-dependent hydrolase (beta-lactamase superfamily II)